MSQQNPGNRDPLTDAPGAHPIGTGIGAAGGAITGAAAGSIGGPIGAAVGGIAGALVGGLAGKGAAEAVNPTVEDAYWRDAYEREPYYQAGRSYDEYRPAYELGWSSARTADTGFDAVEPQLAHEWNSARASSQLDWDQARPATRAAWERAHGAVPGTTAATASAAAAAQSARTETDQDDVADVLDDLLESCRDGEYGFRTAAEHAESAELQGLFLRHSAECGSAALELEREIRNLGKEPSTGGTMSGALHRGWVSVKSVLTTHDDKAVLEECERGEDAAVARYRKALETPLPPALRTLVERQAQGAKRNHDEVRNLRDRYRTAS
ncbi:MAG: PA2169 family four-helix-bundle protein [Comamonadaceae bacterium]|nr:MAG: PA2169 family four-helix-bundle protein [Comamonadaceae bacterium]